jgi:glycosyltransferase involved in cell wall biosynthesis
LTVSHFTSDTRGGAGVAAQRLHAALLGRGTSSRLHIREGSDAVPDSVADRRHSSLLWRNWSSIAATRQWKRSASNRSLFTSARWIYASRLEDFGPSPQIVNLHWISRWIDQPSFFGSIPEEIPVVWSLHDMNPLTGGCHHALDCDRFTKHCSRCPNLRRPARWDAAWRNFRVKARAYARLNLHVVGNSEWTTAQARRSALMRTARSIQTIPLGVDTKEYAPVDRETARKALRIGSEEFVLCFACADVSDQNKGLSALLETLSFLAVRGPVALIVFGAGSLPRVAESIKVIALGPVSSSAVQCLAYSAADVFVTPSRIESFGLTALEAMACGTPVVAFRTGGLPGLIEHERTGLLADEIGSAAGLGTALVWMREHPAERVRMGLASRQRVEDQFTAKLMAERYVELYHRVLSA